MIHVICLLSLLLCIASIALWFRSYRTVDYAAICEDSSEAGLMSSLGRMIFYSESAIEPFRWKGPFGLQYAERRAPESMAEYRMSNESRFGDVMGFGAIGGDNGRYRVTAWFVPHWFVAALAAIGPILWIRKGLRAHSNRGFEPGFEKQK